MMCEKQQILSSLIRDEEYIGSTCCNHSLGIQQMPIGYALMLNPDGTHYYGVKWTREESSEHWNKWAIYNWAKKDSVKSEEESNQ